MSVNQIASTAASRHPSSGPPLAFAAALIVAAGAGTMAAAWLHWDYVFPLVATVMFVLAAATAVMGWRRSRQPGLSYLDVAGALVLIGLAVAVLIDPQQLLRITGAA